MSASTAPRKLVVIRSIVRRLPLQDVLLIGLAFVTGVTDATAFERLGNAFASVITGNLVLLGVGAARGDGRLALLAGCALAGYAIGVFLAAPREREHRELEKTPGVWPPGATRALIADFALLCVVAVLWEIGHGRPGHVLQAVLLSLAAVAMGIQSTAIRRLGQISTTYLTSTFISVFEVLARRAWSHAHTRSVTILCAALGGAAAATGVIVSVPRLVPVLGLVPLAGVIVASRRLRGA